MGELKLFFLYRIIITVLNQRLRRMPSVSCVLEASLSGWQTGVRASIGDIRAGQRQTSWSGGRASARIEDRKIEKLSFLYSQKHIDRIGAERLIARPWSIGSVWVVSFFG